MDQATFVHHLQRSKLLSPDQIRQLTDRHPGAAAVDLARTLVAERLLTPYQAQQLLAGNARGFHLGAYRILDFLGQGSMGSVFRAQHITMERLAAIKVFHKSAFDTAAAHQFFQREVQAVGRLSHPNIVTAFDAGMARGVHFLVMEYVDGPSLERLVTKKGPLAVGLACEVIRQAARGLHYAHALGMVHRDIKPANLLIRHAPGWKGRAPKSEPALALAAEPAPVVKILDFGLARLGKGRDAGGEESTLAVQSGVMFGTPDYVSPEQANDIHAVDIRSDLYSLGCTLYFALSGQVPFPGGNALEKLVKRLAADPVPLAQLRPEVPPGLAAIVKRLMAREPSDRFQTPAELADALAPYCAPEGRGLAAGEMATRYSLNTPADRGGDPGSGWVLEDAFPEDDTTPPAAAAAEPEDEPAAPVPAANGGSWPWLVLAGGAALALAGGALAFSFLAGR
jgi:serine/threonine protein kinase